MVDTIEVEADDAAVSNLSEALDLASAVLKVSHMPSSGTVPQLATGLIQSAEGSIDVRVRRLINWREQQTQPDFSLRHKILYACGLAVFLLLATNYHQLLIEMHSAAEWLVR